MQKIKKAVFPVAGFGTRFLPFTKAVPKEMLPIVDKPVVQILVEEAVKSGIEEIIFITGRNKRAIEDHFDASFELEYLLDKKGKTGALKALKDMENMAKFIFVRQPEPKGDGDAILCARPVIGDEPFCVMFGDDIIENKTPALSQLLEVYARENAPVIGVQEVLEKDIPRFGIVNPDGKGSDFRLKGMVEKPKIEDAPSNLAIVGKFVCTPDIFDALEEAEKSPDGELRLIDGFLKLKEKRDIFAKIIEGERFDTGDKLGFLEATVSYALERDDLGDDFRKFLQKKLGN